MSYAICWDEQDWGDVVVEDFEQCWQKIEEICAGLKANTGGDIDYTPEPVKEEVKKKADDGKSVEVVAKYLAYDDDPDLDGLSTMPLAWISVSEENPSAKLREIFEKAIHEDENYLNTCVMSSGRSAYRCLEKSNTVKMLRDMIYDGHITDSAIIFFVKECFSNIELYDDTGLCALMVAVEDMQDIELFQDLINLGCREARPLAGSVAKHIKIKKTFESLPDHWKTKLIDHIHENIDPGRDILWHSDFYEEHTPKNVRIKLGGNSDLRFVGALHIVDEERCEVAVFTDHCGYYVFPFYGGGESIIETYIGWPQADSFKPMENQL